MPDKKKKWVRPILIVIGRGTPEENVLSGCKNGGPSLGPGADTNCIAKACNANAPS